MPLTVVRDELPPDELLARLRTGDQRPLNALYEQHRLTFLKWAAHRHPKLAEEDLIDAYQDAMLTFYEHIVSGRLVELTSTPQTYLFRLGDRRCQLFSRKTGKIVKVLATLSINGMDNPELDRLLALHPDYADLPADPFDLLDRHTDASRAYEEIARRMQSLPRECRRLLTAVYYESQPTAALITEFEYRDTGVLYARKSHCLARLRTLCRTAA